MYRGRIPSVANKLKKVAYLLHILVYGELKLSRTGFICLKSLDICSRRRNWASSKGAHFHPPYPVSQPWLMQRAGTTWRNDWGSTLIQSLGKFKSTIAVQYCRIMSWKDRSPTVCKLEIGSVWNNVSRLKNKDCCWETCQTLEITPGKFQKVIFYAGQCHIIFKLYTEQKKWGKKDSIAKFESYTTYAALIT